MAEFLNTVEQNSKICQIFREAKKEIYIISPYIKLPTHIRDVLKEKKQDSIFLKIVFGKNEDNPGKSIDVKDLEFFQSFPHVEISYEQNLHAKYYGNETEGLSTSMNLYEFSSNNNKEIGIHVKKNLLLNLNDKLGTNGLDIDNLFGQLKGLVEDIYEKSDTLFLRKPVYEESLMGLKKTYKSSVNEFNSLPEQIEKLQAKQTFQPQRKYIRETITKFDVLEKPKGFCVRTGKPIEFNPKKPMCEEAYVSWLKFSNEEYKEKYCHFSGEVSNGETTFARPILYKNFVRSKELFKW